MTDLPDRAAVRVPPPVWPLLAILLAVGLGQLWPLPLPLEPPPLVRYVAGGGLVAGAILGLGLWPVTIMRRSGQSENPYKPTHAIVERGPFRVTRNPMYLQMILVCLGFTLLLWSAWMLLLTPVCAGLLHHLAIRPEEAYLERKFGEAYAAYKRRVRRWI